MRKSKVGRPSRSACETRALIAARFKVFCADSGLKVHEIAQELHVTERTVYGWLSGATVIPYAAYKLLRVQARFELPGRGWEGWHMHSGKLWTPEGHGFAPADQGWWGLLTRKAAQFGRLTEERDQLKAQLQEAQAVIERLNTKSNRRPGVRAPARHEVPVTLHKRLTDEPVPAAGFRDEVLVTPQKLLKSERGVGLVQVSSGPYTQWFNYARGEAYGAPRRSGGKA